MKNNNALKKKILYRSTHRGTKEMDLFLGNFVKININSLNNDELEDLDTILSIEDVVLQKWLFSNESLNVSLKTKVAEKIKKFKI